MFGQIPWEAILSILIITGILIGFIAWFIRLEAKVLNLEVNSAENKESIWQKLDAMNVTMTTMGQTVARIEGKLEK